MNLPFVLEHPMACQNLLWYHTVLLSRQVNNKVSGTASGGEPLSRIPGMESTSLNAFLRNFDSFLSNPGSLVLPQVSFRHLQKQSQLFKDRLMKKPLLINVQTTLDK